MLPDSFWLTFDPIHASNGILSNITALCGLRIDDVRSELYKINSYGPGGLFREHQDTPREKGYLGTLVVALPTAFEGGEFVLRHGAMEHVLDWSVEGRGAHADELHWVFFYSDVKHEIKPVKSGYRITISYNIYGHPKPYRDARRRSRRQYREWRECGDVLDREYEDPRDNIRPPFTTMDPEYDAYKAALEQVDRAWKLSSIFGGLLAAFQNKAFLPNAGRLAFGLDHEYGFGGRG
jgi:hypothetical protein